MCVFVCVCVCVCVCDMLFALIRNKESGLQLFLIKCLTAYIVLPPYRKLNGSKEKTDPMLIAFIGEFSPSLAVSRVLFIHCT